MDKVFERYLGKFGLGGQKDLIGVYEALEALGFEVLFFDAGPRINGNRRRGCTFRKGDIIIEMVATISLDAVIEEELMDREDIPVGGPYDHILEVQEAYYEDLL